MVRRIFLIAVFALALPGLALADSGSLNTFSGTGYHQSQFTFQTTSGPVVSSYFASEGTQGFNKLFFSQLFNQGSVQFVGNTNRGYFNGFRYNFGNAVVQTPEPGSIALLGISLLGLALAFRKKLKLQPSTN